MKFGVTVIGATSLLVVTGFVFLMCSFAGVQAQAPTGFEDGFSHSAPGDSAMILAKLKDLEAKVKDYEKRNNDLDAFIKASKDQFDSKIGEVKKRQWVWGEFQFREAMVDPTPVDRALRSFRWSKVVKFKFPRRFQSPPQVFICAEQVVMRSPVWWVQVTNVTVDGFDAQLAFNQDGEAYWEYFHIKWIAVPQEDCVKTPGVISQ